MSVDISEWIDDFCFCFSDTCDVPLFQDVRIALEGVPSVQTMSPKQLEYVLKVQYYESIDISIIHMLILVWRNINLFAFSVISEHNDARNWNPFLSKGRTRVSEIVDNRTIDGLVMQGTRTMAAMVLVFF